MGKKDVVLIAIVIILAVGLAVLFLFLAQKQEEVNLANIITNANEQSNVNEPTNGGDEINENTNTINSNTQEEEIKFDDFFRVVYLARFTGQSNPPVESNFTKNDKIVLSARVVDNLKTDLKMTVKIYDGNKELSSAGEIAILDGEVALKNPGKNGSYEARLFIGNTVVRVLNFTIK